MYRLHVCYYTQAAPVMSHWWIVFFNVYRDETHFFVELEDYILTKHHGIYNGSASQYIDFETEEDATAFILTYS